MSICLCVHRHTFNMQKSTQLLFWRCSKETCSLFFALAVSPEGLRPAETHGLPPISWPCQILIQWPARHRCSGKGRGEDHQAQYGAVIAQSQSFCLPSTTNQQEFVLVSVMQKRNTTTLDVNAQERNDST